MKKSELKAIVKECLVESKYFRTGASGNNADIERHRRVEKELLDTIADVENDIKNRDPSDKEDKMQLQMDHAALKTYKRCLDILRQSKAEAANKIGRKK